MWAIKGVGNRQLPSFAERLSQFPLPARWKVSHDGFRLTQGQDDVVLEVVIDIVLFVQRLYQKYKE